MTVNVPGPAEFLPSCPDAIVDLQTLEGAALVGGEWRYSDARVRETSFVTVGPDLGPSGPANRTYEVVPHAQAASFDDTAWTVLAADAAAAAARASARDGRGGHAAGPVAAR